MSGKEIVRIRVREQSNHMTDAIKTNTLEIECIGVHNYDDHITQVAHHH